MQNACDCDEAPVRLLRYTIPNGFTASSLLLGLGSIVAGSLGKLELAAWLIVWCGLLDVMDGLAARLLRATSDFGANFDSMADLVAFGAAPAMLVLQAGWQVGGIATDSGAFWILLVSAGAFVLAGAMRLARFNVSSGKAERGWFTGVPITAAGGGLIATAVILLLRHDSIAASVALQVWFPVALLVLSVAMLSTLRFPKIARRNSRFMNAFQAFNVAASYYCGITRSYPEFLFAMAVLLLIGGIVAGLVTRPRTAATGEGRATM
jgi:CDP-diacylglycerol---serine O-phosphatidyltransferase